ncbi:MAG: hypothetical protein ACLUEJ_09370 [Clostridium sp.]
MISYSADRCGRSCSLLAAAGDIRVNSCAIPAIRLRQSGIFDSRNLYRDAKYIRQNLAQAGS